MAIRRICCRLPEFLKLALHRQPLKYTLCRMTPKEATDYLSTIPADEPTFIFRGRDVFAPAAVGSWAAMCLAQNAVDADGNPLHPATLAKGRRAMALAEEMREWQKKNGSKLPD